MTRERELRIRAFAQGKWKLGSTAAVSWVLAELDAERNVSWKLADAAPRLLVHNSTCLIVIHHDLTMCCTCGVDPMRDALQAYDHVEGKPPARRGRFD